MTDQRIRAQERSATSPEELAELYEARWRSGEWVERQIEVGPCPDRGIHAGRRQGHGGEAGLFTVHASDVNVGDWDPGHEYVTCPTCNGSGVLTIPGRELAAYCGDEAARVLVPVRLTRQTVDKPLHWSPGAREFVESGGILVPCDFGAWVRGLSRYGREACVRAAVAAARAVIADWERGSRPVEALWHGPQATEAAERWLADPSEANEDAWAVLLLQDVPDWVPTINEHLFGQSVRSATEILGEQPTRKAIQDALIPWALHVEEAPEGAEEQPS